VGLLPRVVGYLIKGLRNGLGRETIRAVLAAVRLSASLRPSVLPAGARDYLRRNDALHRGWWWNRIRAEVLATLVARKPARLGMWYPLALTSTHATDRPTASAMTRPYPPA